MFAVVQMNVDEPLALPRVEADDLAASIPEDAPSSSSSAFVSTSPPRGEDLEGFEDEDFELQAALQASLMGSSTSHPSRPSEVHVGSNSGSSSSGPSRSFTVPFSLRSHNRAGGTRTPTQAPARSLYPVVNDVDDDSDNDGEEEERFHTPPSLPPLPLPLPYHPTQFPPPPLPRQLPTRSQTQPEIDPVEASRLRSQAFMDHVLRQQQQAFQEQYMVEAARTRAGIVPPRSARQVTEEEELQRAIEESRALAEAQGHPIEIDQDQDHENDNNVDEDEDIVVVEAPVIPDNSLPRMNTGGSSFDREVHRVYDDDDAELQAALKASLESVPEGFRIPSTPPRFEPSAPLAASAPFAPLLPTQSSSNSLPNPNQATSTNNMTARPIVDRTRSVESESQTDGEYQSETDVSGMEEEEVPVSVEEMRRRRLAKFGG